MDELLSEFLTETSEVFLSLMSNWFDWNKIQTTRNC